ncbi:MAG TPA: hypothetical protein VI953_04980 [Candidatus Paceibacterota bacterium]
MVSDPRFLRIAVTARVECPKCKKLRPFDKLLAFENSYNGGDETLHGYALATRCCLAIVVKTGDFDLNRGVLNMGVDALEKLGCQKVGHNLVIFPEPELIRRTRSKKATPPDTKTYYELSERSTHTKK